MAQETKEARLERAGRAQLRAEAAEYACKACKGHGKRIVPNTRERGIPPQDFGPGFVMACPNCGGTGKAPRARIGEV
jgi:DnaJ-class molecular chaperone